VNRFRFIESSLPETRKTFKILTQILAQFSGRTSADCQDEVLCSADPGRPPGEVPDLALAGDLVTLSWTGVPRADVYDILTGDLNALRPDGGFASAYCEGVRVPNTTHTLTEPLAPGTARYYLIRGKGDQCKLGTWGSALRDEAVGGCP
jgi:hypothetical protein